MAHSQQAWLCGNIHYQIDQSKKLGQEKQGQINFLQLPVPMPG